MRAPILPLLLTMLIGLQTPGAATTAPSTTRPAGGAWDPTLFRYDKPNPLVIEVSTPTPRQVNWILRPPKMTDSEPDPKKLDGPEVPASVGALDVLLVKFRDADGDVVPALLCTPKGKKGPFPVVIAVHGLTSNKAQVVAQVGPALAKRGFAIIAPDVPRHGERPGTPWSLLDASNPRKSFEIFRQIVRDVRMCIDVAEQRPELDTKTGVVFVGYSMGSWIGSVAGPADDRIKAMVLMVGGATGGPRTHAMPQRDSVDPRNAIPHFAPRPLLLLNANVDTLVTPEMAKRLFAECDKSCCEQRWYDCGHLLTADAYEDAAAWVETVWKDRSAQTSKKKAG
jgi:dienelactone hydrolase